MAGGWATVDWSRFDLVGVNLYRSGTDQAAYARRVASLVRENDKPVVVTEFGCGAFAGAGQRGPGSFRIVNRFATPPGIRGDHPRDESTQARYLGELIELYAEAGVHGCFVFTFSMPDFPHREDPEVKALRALTTGDRELARERLAHVTRPLLNAALRTYLTDESDGRVYDQPAAFTAFIRGGGNIALYDAVSAALAGQYERLGVTSLVDLGCGDGRALIPALRAAKGTAPAVTLVEPSRALLDAALAGLPTGTIAHATDASTFAAALTTRFDLVQSTFALHALPPDERSAVLTAVRGHVSHLVLAEFDHPGEDADRLTFLADTYEQGLAEYDDTDRDLVAQGFLMPVLTGQLTPGARRSTWEQPATAWAEQVESCGYRNVVIESLCDYWSSPALLLTAEA